MSKFSEFLESCVHNSSYNITQLAKLSGVNRTHLQKILIGERFLNNEELFDRLLSNLHLSWEKEQELRRLYRIEQIGEKRYEQMLNVIEFFKGFQKPAQIAATPSYTLIRANSQGTFSIQGRNSILYYLQNALGNVKAIGKQDIFLLAQDSYPPLFEILASQLYGLHDIHLEHILYYQADDEADSNHFIQNMKLSRNILPLLLANIDYIPLAIYQGHLEHQLSQSLLPYLYVDDAIVINFNADITSAMISFDKGLIAFYRNLFLKQKKKAIALTHSYQNTDFFETYYNGMNQAHAKQYYLIYGPCLLKHMPIEAIFQHVHPEYQTNNEFLSGLHDYLVKIGQSLNSVNYFTKQGVLLFMENGRDFQIPSFLYEPTTLTVRMAEDLSSYLKGMDFKVAWLHHEVKTIERTEIIRDLRRGKYDVLIGINLLREGLDIPEVSLIAILDADKEGFLRSERSLIQIIGRAARNAHGEVIMYADTITGSMQKALDETARRREIQIAYNKEHGITPKTIIKPIHEVVRSKETQEMTAKYMSKKAKVTKKDKEKLLVNLEKEMKEAAKVLDFERAAELRDILIELRNS